MATAGPSFDHSLLPIFLSRLRLVQAIVPGLLELPRPSRNELQSLLERAEKLIVEAMEGPVSPESAPKS